MKSIPLTQGHVALVDDVDYTWLSKLRWCYSSDGYATNTYTDELGRRHRRSMHRMIMGRGNPLPRSLQVDHINRDRIDNRRSNLRYATRTQNQANMNKQIVITVMNRSKPVITDQGTESVEILYRGVCTHAHS